MEGFGCNVNSRHEREKDIKLQTYNGNIFTALR